MKLIDVILAAEGRVSGGSEYCWNCWGYNARFMEFADVDGQVVIGVHESPESFDEVIHVAERPGL